MNNLQITNSTGLLSVAGTATIASLVLSGGCALFFPHPNQESNVIGDADAPQDGRCSLAVAQIRKSLPAQIVADGIPTPLIIHSPSATATHRGIDSGQSVYFETLTRSADAPPMSSPWLWQIESVDSTGAAVSGGGLIITGGVVNLRTHQATGYLKLDQTTNETKRNEASRFILYKADVPDATRPTTCDEQVRDQDFVFIGAVDSNAWVTVSDAGVLSARYALPVGIRTTSGSHPLCTREEEQCHTGPRGGLVCVWAPVCGD